MGFSFPGGWTGEVTCVQMGAPSLLSGHRSLHSSPEVVRLNPAEPNAFPTCVPETVPERVPIFQSFRVFQCPLRCDFSLSLWLRPLVYLSDRCPTAPAGEGW